MISILHLEDSPLDAQLVRSWLARDGCGSSITWVDDRPGFLDALRGGRFDVILADHSLPDFDGLEALELARSLAPETPFLFVSGQLGEEVAIDTLHRGATDYVLKQRPQRLVPAVRRALAESSERAARRKAEQALREGEARHRLILDSITDYAVVTSDNAGLVLSWSAGAERVFGWSEAEALGAPVDRIFTPEDLAAGAPAAEIARAAVTGRADADHWYRRRDGGPTFWGQCVVVPLADSSGAPVGFTRVIRDATESKRAEDALIEADRRKDEFLAMLAHELRNPLSAIHNAVALSKARGLGPEQLSWSQEVIAHQVRHLARLVDDLLDVSRITRGKIKLQPERVDAGEVVRRAVEGARALIDERGHKLDVTVGPGPLTVLADPARLEQVVANLLTNAAKYTDPGGHVALTARREDGDVAIRVKDDGVGMGPEMLSRAFDLFAQADQSLDRTKGGLGIGLTLARRLIEMQGGTVVARSAGPGLGSEFEARLPAASPSADGAEAPPCKAEDNGRPTPGSRILVVDDNEINAQLLAELLRSAGHEVATAHDGAAAIEAARRERPEVLLLDIGLPVLDGYQVAQAIRGEPGFDRALIVAITGYGEEAAVARSRDAGFDHHLVKPVDLDRLMALLSRHAVA